MDKIKSKDVEKIMQILPHVDEDQIVNAIEICPMMSIWLS